MYDAKKFVNVVDRMVTVAESMSDDAVFTELTAALTAVFDIVGTSVLVLGDDDDLHVASTSGAIEAIERCQTAVQHGPAYDAFRGSRIVAVADIARARHRWPQFVDVAAHAGIGGVAAFPLQRGNDDVMGSLVLYSTVSRAWSATDLDATRVLARLAIAQRASAKQLRTMTEVSEQLQHALESRIVIEQAKGVLAATSNIDTEAAFERMRHHARRHRMRLRDVAQAVVDYRVRL